MTDENIPTLTIEKFYEYIYQVRKYETGIFV